MHWTVTLTPDAQERLDHLVARLTAGSGRGALQTMAATITYLQDLAAVDTTLFQAVELDFRIYELVIWNVLGVIPMEQEHLTVEAVLSMDRTIGRRTLPCLELVLRVMMQGASIWSRDFRVLLHKQQDASGSMKLFSKSRDTRGSSG